MTILDVGSGVGKLCLVGAATTEASWVGAELDPAMVCVAECAARKLRLTHNLRFVSGNAHDLDWSTFDSLYMFNPFAEDPFDSTLTDAGRRARFSADIERTKERLARVRAGTRLVTLHGFGGEVPDCFELEHREAAHDDFLCLWVRRPDGRTRTLAGPSTDLQTPSAV